MEGYCGRVGDVKTRANDATRKDKKRGMIEEKTRDTV